MIGLVHAFGLFVLIIAFGAVSGGHFNPAVTLAATIQRKIDPVDAVVYILAQLSGAVLGALLVKGLLLDEGRALGYGNAEVSSLLERRLRRLRRRGARHVPPGAGDPRRRDEPACPPGVGAVAIGATLGFLVMIFGPLTGGSFNPARWFGPALIGDRPRRRRTCSPYVLGPIVGALIASAVYRFVIAGPQFAEGPEPPTSDARAVGQAVKDAETRARNQ